MKLCGNCEALTGRDQRFALSTFSQGLNSKGEMLRHCVLGSLPKTTHTFPRWRESAALGTHAAFNLYSGCLKSGSFMRRQYRGMYCHTSEGWRHAYSATPPYFHPSYKFQNTKLESSDG